MKKMLCVLAVMLGLCGCSGPEYETMADEYTPLPAQEKANVVIALAQEVETAAFGGDDSRSLTFCDGYTVCQETFDAGDLNKTLQTVTGYSRDQLTLLKQMQSGAVRYDFVFTCAGEGGSQICRGSILDDGNYHYVLTAMASEALSGALQGSWESLFSSYRIEPGPADTETGTP